MTETLIAVLSKNALITAFAVVGIIIWLSYWLSDRISAGRIHGSAIAITVGLVLAYFGGVQTGGRKGIADILRSSGSGLLTAHQHI